MSLKNQGSDLMIRFGVAENIIPELVSQVNAVEVFVEEEVEYTLRKMIDFVDQSLSTLTLSQKRPQIALWQTPFYDIKSLKELPTLYSDFEKLKLSPTSPLECPGLPRCDIELDWGSVPTFDDVKRYMNENPWKPSKSWSSIKAVSAKNILKKGRFGRVEMENDMIEVLEDSVERNQVNLGSEWRAQRKRLENSAFLSKKGNVVGGRTSVVLNALSAYLRYLEGTSKDEWQEVHEKLRNAESRSGASFRALFGSALFLGIISRRRVYYEAIKYERERNAGFLSPFGYSAATIAAAADTVCSMEWYWLMALKSQRNNEGRYSVRIWRWNGYLIQYTVVGREGPAIVLVHGFGAFLEHYRDNVYDISEAGNRVWAITLLGFGKSEKPNIVYTELMWAELLRDFIVDVVGEPAHLVGNSIGAYFVAIVAGLWPAVVKSVVLINTAGSVVPGYSSVPITEERRPSGAAWLGSRLLLFYLKLRVGNIVKNCYSTNTGRADDWLIDEMLRASHDPGVLVVLESIFNFNLSIPLNYLLEPFEGKVLIIQGMKDPLSKSEYMLSMFKEHCNGVIIKELDAGHCPHDERPEEVNSFIHEWVETYERKPQLC
ncbi:DNA photolyase [Macleaya cordata]|uniref:DNA photolyase n=1 Tax=Macleaya cordata TaxID=56857 RepID=A0A200QVP7_MACCD|nr:DNA photolyase [Macleaya cordata]